MIQPTDPVSGDPELALRRSWRANAAAWTDAVRGARIPSRRAGTDAAILESVAAEAARVQGTARVLDLGCGEGWLARALAERGCAVTGIDGSPELIEAARALGGARFEVARYDELVPRATELGAPFDIVIFNFALLGEDVGTPLAAARRCLRAEGALIVQTVHPWVACGDAPYADGWRVETFATFGDAFAEPMPWYFRTLESWAAAVAGSGLTVRAWREPLDASTGRPLSLLLLCRPSTTD